MARFAGSVRVLQGVMILVTNRAIIRVKEVL